LYVDILREYGEHYLLAKELTLKAIGLLKADSVFLINKGACAIVEDAVFHMEFHQFLSKFALRYWWRGHTVPEL